MLQTSFRFTFSRSVLTSLLTTAMFLSSGAPGYARNGFIPRYVGAEGMITRKNNLNPDLTGLNTILQDPDSTTIKNHTDTLCKLWVDKQNGEYKNQHTFMDILMENINFKKTSLQTTNLQETSQFRAILKGICKSVEIQESDPIWHSINKLDVKAASLWFQAIIAARSKDQTFFSSYFNLIVLALSDNKLSSVNVSQNTALTALNLSNNPSLKKEDIKGVTSNMRVMW